MNDVCSNTDVKREFIDLSGGDGEETMNDRYLLFIFRRYSSNQIDGIQFQCGRSCFQISFVFQWICIAQKIWHLTGRHTRASADFRMKLKRKWMERKWNEFEIATKSIDWIPTAINAFVSFSSWYAKSTQCLSTLGNSSTPLGHRKHLKPTTPRSSIGFNCFSLPGMIPPQNPTSTCSLPLVASSLATRFATVVVGGMEFLESKCFQRIN